MLDCDTHSCSTPNAYVKKKKKTERKTKVNPKMFPSDLMLEKTKTKT